MAGATTPATNLGFDLVVSEAEVLEVGRRVGLDRRELVLQHLDHLWQLRIPPPKLSAETRNTEAESLLPGKKNESLIQQIQTLG